MIKENRKYYLNFNKKGSFEENLCKREELMNSKYRILLYLLQEVEFKNREMKWVQIKNQIAIE
jgi:hypothetical protein